MAKSRYQNRSEHRAAPRGRLQGGPTSTGRVLARRSNAADDPRAASEATGGVDVGSKPVQFGPGLPLPLAAVSQGTTEGNHTGSWRYLRPRYENKMAPCRTGCPAAVPVEAVMRLVEEGREGEAAARILMENPFPSICGRVCYHPCETACNRKGFDSALAIPLIERFVGDEAAEVARLPEMCPLSGGHVAVVGSGPAGLAAAYFLRLLGHRVTVFEAEEQLGGILRYGIPPYRLPRDVLDREVERILALDVRVETGKRVGRDVPWSELEGFDARFLAPGLGQSRALRLAGEEAENVESGLAFLRRFNAGISRHVGKRMFVIGGGNTAIDVVRTAVRAGCPDVNLVYRRTRNEMPAMVGEVEEAAREGVNMHFLSLPTQLLTGHNQCVVAMQITRMRPGEPDASGRARPIPVEGSERILETDHVIVAIGEAVHPTAMPKDAELVKDDGLPRIVGAGGSPFVAGGDLSNDTLMVVHAVASAKTAALAIDSELRKRNCDWAGLRVGDGGVSFARYRGEGEEGSAETASLDDINLDYFNPEERARTPRLSFAERIAGFSEVNRGLLAAAARTEAGRCFHCGVCTLCDNCYQLCPDVAVAKTADSGLSIRYEFCKGCGICVAECPRGAMEMVADEDR